MSAPVVLTTVSNTKIEGFSNSSKGTAVPSTDSANPPGSWVVTASITGPLGNSYQQSVVPDRPTAISLLVILLAMDS